MLVALKYISNPLAVIIRLQNIQGRISDVEISYRRERENHCPEFITELFHLEHISDVYCTIGNTLHVYQAGNVQPWKTVLPNILIFLRDTFAPEERITLQGNPIVLDRQGTSDDLLQLPDREPFGEFRQAYTQLTFDI